MGDSPHLDLPSFRVLEKNGFQAQHSGCDERGEFVYMVRNAAE